MPLYWIAELLGPDSSSLPNFNVIAAADFDGRRIAEYTEGFRRGLIVKGLAAGTPANAKWSFKWLRQQTVGKGVEALVKLDRAVENTTPPCPPWAPPVSISTPAAPDALRKSPAEKVRLKSPTENSY